MLDNDFLNNIAVLVVAVLVGLVGYFRKRPNRGMTASVAAIGLGWLEREQTERMLSSIDTQARAQVRMAEALEALADKKTTDMSDHLKHLISQVDDLLITRPATPQRQRQKR